MLSLCLALALAQTPVEGPAAAPADAPVSEPAPALTPADDGLPAAELPVRQPEDPKKWPRVFLSGGAGALAGGAALGAMLLFAGARTSVNPSGGSFDIVFGTTALAALLIPGVDFAVHQALGGGGEISLAALASIGVMALTGLAVGASGVDPVTGAVLVAAVGSVPAAISVTAILEATQVLTGRRRVW